MKTAIFYSGQARTFASCFKNQYWMVLRHFQNPTFYVSVADDAEAGSMELLKKRFSDVNIEYVKQPDFLMADQWAKDYSHAGYSISAKPQNVMRAFWGYKQAWNMKPEDVEFDLYVRIRPDLWFQEFEMPHVWDIMPGTCLTPPWGSYGGINDRLALMGKSAAERYMLGYDKIQDLLSMGCPFHPETMTRAAVEIDHQAICCQTLKAEFRIRRMADIRSPYIEKRQEWLVPEPMIGYELMRASL